jgi:glycosyltransferase involved in cell wall biosynthesis
MSGLRRALQAPRRMPAELCAFLEGADAALRGASVDVVVSAVERFQPLAFAENGGAAAAFWEELSAEAAETSRGRRRSGRLRSLWGVTPIVSLRYGAQADRRLGLHSDTLVFQSYYVTSQFDINLTTAQTHILQQRPELHYAFRRFVLAWALLSYDIFHLYNDCGLVEPRGGYGSSFYGIAELEMQAYRKAGKALFTYPYGADHRMRNRTLSLAPLNFCMECPEPGKYCICDDEVGERVLSTISQYATRMIGYGLSMDLLPDARWMGLVVVDEDELKPQPFSARGSVLRVGHFPNHGFFKGTRHLEEAIETLRAAGRPIELVRLSGLPRDRILAAMAEVDVVVDQLISGAFGITAAEAMALGRPVIAHLRPGVRIAAPAECPVIPADPATIVTVLDRLIDDREALRAAAQAGPAYVRSHLSVPALAASLAELYGEYLPAASVGGRVRMAVRADRQRRIAARPPAQAPSRLREVTADARVAAGAVGKRLRDGFWWRADQASTALVRLCVKVGRRLSRRRIARGRPRSLWGTTPILTLPLKARCDRLLGIRSSSLVFNTYVITKRFDIDLTRIMEPARKLSPRLYAVLSRLVLSFALLRYDIFNYFADHGIMYTSGVDLWELELLHAAEKRIYIYCYGADVRTRARTLSLGTWNFCRDCTQPGRYCVCDEGQGAANMANLSAHATAIVAMGDMLEYVPRPKPMHYWPIELSEFDAAAASGRAAEGPLRIAHAPNHTHFKGTQYLRSAIENLRSLGHAIELVTVQGVPNAQVKALFAEADVVADQFIGGAYGYTALEAMALAKPVLTYVRRADLVEAPDECPLIMAQPETLQSALMWLLENRQKLRDIGRQGRAYVERWHSVPAVAARFAALYLDTARFPEHMQARLRAFIAAEVHRRDAVAGLEGWQHEWQVTRVDSMSENQHA